MPAGSTATMHKLRPLRRERAMTQKDLADLSGVGYVTISRLERGETPLEVVRPSTIKKLAGALGVPVTTLTRCGPPSGGEEG